MVFCVPAFAQDSKADLSVGYNYQRNDQGNGYANLNGWYGAFTWNLSDKVGLAFESDNNWGHFKGQSLNQHTFLAGPSFKFNNQGKVQPVIELLAGDQRSSSPGDVNHAFSFQPGLGFDVKLSKKVSLDLQPAGYSLAFPHGNARHSYSAKVGLSFSLGG
jgi:hypothetical protein